MRFSIKMKIIILCSAFLLLFIPSVLFLMLNLERISKTHKSAIHASEYLITRSKDLAKLIVDMETGQRGFIITGKEDFLEPFEAANKKFDELLKVLRENLGGQSKYLGMLEKVEHLRYQWMEAAGKPEIKARRLVNETEVSLKTIDGMILEGKGKQILDKIREVVSTMTDDFKKADRKDELILITQISKDIVDSETGERGFLLAGKDRFLEPYYDGQASFSRHVKELEKILQVDKVNLERLGDVRSLYEDWLVKAAKPEIHTRKMYEKNPQSMDDIAVLLSEGTGKKIIDELRKVIDEFTDDLTNDINREFSQSQQRVIFAKFISMAVGGGGILLSLIIAIILGRAIIDPIRMLTEGTIIIGRGDLDHKIILKSKDELGVLAGSFNKMTEDLGKSKDDLIEAKDYTENVISSMLDCLVVIDPDGKIRMVNQAVCDLLGYKEEELEGKDVSALFLEEEEEEERTFKDTKLQKLIKEGAMSDYEAKFKTKNDNKIPVLLSGAVMRDNKGEITNIVCVAKDITERKKAEEEVQAVNLRLTENEQKLKDANEELAENVALLEKFNKSMTGRETRVIEVKTEVNELSKELGRPEPYKLELNEK